MTNEPDETFREFPKHIRDAITTTLDKLSESSFPSLDKLADEFTEKNGILGRNGLLTKAQTHGGLVLNFGRENLALLSVSRHDLMSFMGGFQLHPYLGGNGSHMYSADDRTYILSGRVNEKEIHLETRITSIRDYVAQKRENMCPFATNVFKPSEEKPKLTFNRKDDFQYWFITEPNKSKKD